MQQLNNSTIKMKLANIVLATTITLLFGVSCSEVTVDEPVKQEYFMKFYGNYHSDFLYDLAVNTEEEIVLTGYRRTEEGIEEGWLIKTDSYGMIDWKEKIEGNTNSRIYGLLIDGSVYCSGYREVEGSSGKEGFLYQYNSKGDLLDTLAFDIQVDKIKDMKFLVNDNNTRILAHVNRNGTDQVYIYGLAKTDSVSLLATNQLPGIIDGKINFHELKNGNVYITGSLKEDDEEGQTDIMLSHLVDNNISWTYIFGEDEKSERASGIIMHNNYLYVAASNHQNGNPGSSEVYLLQLTQDGVETDTMNVSLTGSNVPADMLYYEDNRFVIVGDRKEDKKNSDIFMSVISDEGETLIEKSYGYKGLSGGKIAVKLPSGQQGYIIAGDITTSPLSPDAVDVLVIKANENGEWID